ncbi:MAG: efflux RND transporter periplasmic adaptor subunit [Hydrogenophilales bacterium]|nr:efflux RND transporter periplasmic adaptor subunit [Hydrogenophilales bacterium]
MKSLPIQRRTLGLLAVIVPLLALFVYVGLRSGPLAPVAVTVVKVEARAVAPALFGIGTVEARYTYKIGPTYAGRIKRLDVHVGDAVKAGQVLGESDPVDLDDRVRSQESASKRAMAGLREAEARQGYALMQARRYEKLQGAHWVSEEFAATKRQELQIAEAVLSAAREDMARALSDRDALVTQRNNLRLVAPVDGVVAVRDADPGTTVVAGQAILEIIDPKTLWLNVRFDQLGANNLAAGLPAHLVLRSRAGQALPGKVLRIEPMADTVTEETLAKVAFDTLPLPLPPVGELAEVTVDLPALPAMPVVPNAAIRRQGEQSGVWRLVDGQLNFVAIKQGASDLNGFVQVRDGLKAGDRVVLYSEKALTARSRFHIVERIAGISK